MKNIFNIWREEPTLKIKNCIRISGTMLRHAKTQVVFKSNYPLDWLGFQNQNSSASSEHVELIEHGGQDD